MADLSEREWDAVGVAAAALSLRVGMAPTSAGRNETTDDEDDADPTEDRGAPTGSAEEQEVVR